MVFRVYVDASAYSAPAPHKAAFYSKEQGIRGCMAGHLCRAFDPYCDCLYPSGPPARPGSPPALVFWISGGHHSGLYAAGNGRQTVVYSEIPYIVVGEGT